MGGGWHLLILGPPLPAVDSGSGSGIHIHLGDFLGISECLPACVCVELSPAMLGHCLPPAVSEALCSEVGKRTEETDLTDVSEVSLKKRMCILNPKENKVGF